MAVAVDVIAVGVGMGVVMAVCVSACMHVGAVAVFAVAVVVAAVGVVVVVVAVVTGVGEAVVVAVGVDAVTPGVRWLHVVLVVAMLLVSEIGACQAVMRIFSFPSTPNVECIPASGCLVAQQSVVVRRRVSDPFV